MQTRGYLSRACTPALDKNCCQISQEWAPHFLLQRHIFQKPKRRRKLVNISALERQSCSAAAWLGDSKYGMHGQVRTNQRAGCDTTYVKFQAGNPNSRLLSSQGGLWEWVPWLGPKQSPVTSWHKLLIIEAAKKTRTRSRIDLLMMVLSSKTLSGLKSWCEAHHSALKSTLEGWKEEQTCGSLPIRVSHDIPRYPRFQYPEISTLSNISTSQGYLFRI